MTYHLPTNLSDALKVLSGGPPRVIAGGTDVFATLQDQVLRGGVLDLSAVKELSGVSRTDSGWRIGAATKWADIAGADLPPAFNALKQAAGKIGSVQIQNSGTVGGNLCNASPAADGVPPLLVLDAEVELISDKGVRCLPLNRFITGVRKTALEPGELVSALLVADDKTTGVSAFQKLGTREYLVISTSMVAARLDISVGNITGASIAVGACSPIACRISELEDALVGTRMDDLGKLDFAIPAMLAKVLSPISDIRSDAEYRIDTASTLISRTLTEIAALVKK